jgi:maltooligosyltrehalose trehalohydrolase
VLPQSSGGVGLDAVWSDDLHHQLRVALCGERHGHFADYGGSAADLATTLERGWFYQGEPSRFREGRSRGSPAAGIAPTRFVHFIQNHDQIGNRPEGDRVGAAVPPAAFRAASALLLLAPSTPLLFMGEEWNASTPFLYFTDHGEELGRAVREGRLREFEALRGSKPFEGDPPDPQALATFERSRLCWDERALPGHAGTLRLHRELLRLRRTHPALRARDRFRVAAVGERAVSLLRVGGGTGLLLLVNLGGAATIPVEAGWATLLSTEDPGFDGAGGVTLSGGEARFDGAGALLLERRG